MTKKTVCLLVATMCLAVSAFAAAPEGKGKGKGRTRGGGAGEIPTPFLSSNQRVELADGELYTLVGRIQFHREQPFLEVDLGEHPWLANQKRKSIPYYPLEASAEYWRRYQNLRVRVYVEAHGDVQVSEISGASQHVISLLPLADPSVLERAPAPRSPAKGQ